MSVFIKPADKNDFAAIADIHNRAILPFLDIYSDEEKAAFGDHIFETPEEIAEAAETRQIICAMQSDQITGFAIFRSRNGQTLWVSSLYVDPIYQRKNVGQALLQYIEGFAMGHGHSMVALKHMAKPIGRSTSI